MRILNPRHLNNDAVSNIVNDSDNNNNNSNNNNYSDNNFRIIF